MTTTELLVLQEDGLEQLIKTEKNFRKSPKERITQSYVETRIENLNEGWKDFKNRHIQIISTISEEDKQKVSYFKKDIYSEFEERYTDYRSNLRSALQRLNILPSTSTSQVPTNSCEIKLPRIQLPTFTGNYEEWQAFYDMFLSVIHNNSNLSAVQRLHYLKSSLSGEAANLISNLPTTELNYDEAWKQLLSRYNNKRYNSNAIFRKLFAQKQTTESASAVKNLLDTTSSCIKTLNNIGIDTSSWDAILVYLTVSKLDQESHKLWELKINENTCDDFPSWSQLAEFLQSRFRALEMLNTNKIYQPKQTFTNVKARTYHAVNNEQKENMCLLCSEPHYLYQCKKFGRQSQEERQRLVQTNGLCYNCLAPGHAVKKCRQATSCRRCGRRHHSLLHFEKPNNVSHTINTKTTSDSTTSNEENSINSNNETRVVTAFSKGELQRHNVLLATALVKTKSRSGYNHIIRALLDQGSQASFVSEATAQLLGLKRISVNGLVSGLGNGQTRARHMVSLHVQSCHNPENSIHVNAFVLSTLTSFLPIRNLSITDRQEIDQLQLADVNYGSPGKIDILLGAEVYSQILVDGIIKIPQGPVAQNTVFGWILSGPVIEEESLKRESLISLHLRVREDELLKAFWDIETEPDMLKKRLTKDEQRCEEIYETTTKREPSGRYIVRLPFKNKNPGSQYGKSKQISLKRFYSLEKRLLKNPNLHEDYRKVIEEYLELGHMVRITNHDVIEKESAVYLPHHAVVREDKETTKVRVVFDASCKGINNVSLNDDLLIGPKLQDDLRHIVMRWRRHRICMVADIVKMYRMVKIHDEDTDFQRILWRSNPNEPIQHFRLLTLTFGTAAAPYLAVKSLQQLAKDERAKYPTAAHITESDFYMDDLMTGCETEAEAIMIFYQMNQLMREGGFQLQKWCTNSSKLLDHIEKSCHSNDENNLIKLNNLVKVLGIGWKKSTDNFNYIITLPEQEQFVTKRQILSEIARLFDPMGWIAPIMIIAKIYIQKLWKSGLGWDDVLTDDLLAEWLKFRNDLVKIKHIELPRWIHWTTGSHTELHAFADASKAAYAAVVYMKVTNGNGERYVTLITAKTKVAPIQREVTIPRLELCAALLAAKLLFEVAQVMNISREHWYAWSDSTVVLAWLRSVPSRWTTFVGNRTSEILNILDCNQWSHVAGHENPADVASRGLSVEALRNYDVWWRGPTWLRQTPNLSKGEQEFTTNEEERSIKTLTTTINTREEFLWTRFSNITRMLRVLTCCKRVLRWKLSREMRNKLPNSIETEEMNEVLQICIKQCQAFHFSNEIRQLRSAGSVPKKSPIHSLSPFIDQTGVLRVGGRINQARVEYDKKHPMILPAKSHLTKLIILDAHIKTLHGGIQIMMNYLRSKFWIVRAKNQIKKYFKECVTCVRYLRQNNNQFMGQLPEVRLTPSKPFTSTGVDFSGYINIRFSPGRGSKSYKGYICLFVCMVTKAVHLEAVSDLTAPGFIAAFRRFTSRRGQCKDIYSDNGTNFVGADKLLKEMFDKAKSSLPNEIAQLLITEGTTWHFIPPHGPNFGGLWESGIRSTKMHLKRVIGDSTLTFEEVSTVLAQVEACLNSRPLTQISDDPDDPLPLTPGHFLVGEPTILIPDEDHTQNQITGMHRWRLTQKMVADFWKRWANEYLVTLNQRHKWTTKRTGPEVNDIVIIKDDNLPPAKWLLGRILQKHSGKDNITRVVTIKTKTGILKRPCNKLCLLPKGTSDSD